MKNILITGANRGLGLEFVKNYLKAGHRVFATCRAPKQATDLAALSSDYASLSVYPLDVSDGASILALGESLKGQELDLLINNAGVFGPKDQGFAEVSDAEILSTFQTNALGPLRVSQTLLPQLSGGADKKIVTITSAMGSIGDSSGGYYAYRASKAAVNMLMHNFAFDLKPAGIGVYLVHPGWVQTDMGGAGATLSPSQSIEAMVKTIDNFSFKNTGCFVNYNGQEYAW